MHLPLRRAALPLALSVLFVLPASVVGAEYRTGEAVSVSADDTIEDDLYVAAGEGFIDGTVTGDLTIAGGHVEIRGHVGGAVNVTAGDVIISGTVDGAVRSMAGSVTIEGQVGRDVVLAGGDVVISPEAAVGGDLAGAAGSARVEGTVSGDLLIGAGELTIQGTVGGSVDSNVGQLRLASGATIEGDLLYASEQEAQIADDATVGGRVERREPEWTGYAPLLPDNPFVTFLGTLLGLLVLGWGMMLIRPGLVVLPGSHLQARPLASLGVGLAVWIGQFLLLVALVILAVVAGMLAAAFGGAFLVPFVIVLFAVIAYFFVSQVYVAMAIGRAVAALTAGISPWLAYAVGALVWAALLTLVGILAGPLAALIFLAGWILGLGALTLHQLARRRENEPPANPPDQGAPAPAY